MGEHELTKEEQIAYKHEQDLERLRAFRLMDDDFMTACFDGSPESVELVLRIILNKPDLCVLDVKVQYFIKNLLKRSVSLDVLATDTDGRKYNIEIQRSDKGAGAKRARYNSSMIDAKSMEKSTGFDELPESLREMAELRLQYPDATLKELGEYLDPPVGKSGVNHRLRKLSAIAEDL